MLYFGVRWDFRLARWRYPLCFSQNRQQNRRPISNPLINPSENHTMQKLIGFWKEWRGTLLFVILFLAFRSAFADWYGVPTGSMKPTIIEGDRIFVNKVAYDIKIPFTLISLKSWDKPKRGDIVVFDSPVEDIRLIKRVVGVPGDKILIRNNQLFINNKSANYAAADQSMVSDYWSLGTMNPLLVREKFDNGAPHTIALLPSNLSNAGNYGPITVPEKHYFMLGDNRDNSADSRFIGAIHEKYILGKANKVVLSLQRTDRFFHELP